MRGNWFKAQFFYSWFCSSVQARRQSNRNRRKAGDETISFRLNLLWVSSFRYLNFYISQVKHGKLVFNNEYKPSVHHQAACKDKSSLRVEAIMLKCYKKWLRFWNCQKCGFLLFLLPRWNFTQQLQLASSINDSINISSSFHSTQIILQVHLKTC